MFCTHCLCSDISFSCSHHKQLNNASSTTRLLLYVHEQFAMLLQLLHLFAYMYVHIIYMHICCIYCICIVYIAPLCVPLIYLSISIYLYLYLSIYLSIYLYVCIYILIYILHICIYVILCEKG